MTEELLQSVKLKAGDVVVLNSGGPQMTIISVFQSPSLGDVDAASVIWLADGKEQKSTFPLACLTLVTGGTPAVSLNVPALNNAITSGKL